ncbi:MAG: DNA methylase [Chloroflexi bacterium]|nr:DNA methylase [Chloroflexota bacterium]
MAEESVGKNEPVEYQASGAKEHGTDTAGRSTAGQPPRVARTTGYSDIDLSRWKEYDEIQTGSLWLFPTREKGNGHSLDYHGNYVPQIATQTFLRYTKRYEIILDLFLGSGTSAIEALRLGRRCIGLELKQELVDHVRAKLPPDALGREATVLQGDATATETLQAVRAALAAMQATAAQLLVLHPPYHDIIKFSDRPEDLSNTPSVEAFLARFEVAARNGYDLLEPGRFAVLIIGDKYSAGQFIPLGFYCMQRMNDVGFTTKALVVKNIEGNEIGKGKTNNLWRYRALAGGFYIFKHEYVMVFRKG